MAQVPCEASLRPDWLSTSFKSGSDRHRQTLFDFAQGVADRFCPSGQWEDLGPSRHFDKVFKHNHGLRFETSDLKSEKNPGISLLSMSGEYFALSSVYEQMRTLRELLSFKGRYHFTRLDVQVTTLDPSQSAEQIVQDVAQGVLWVKGFKNWEPRGLVDINGDPTGGFSAYFGSPKSDRQAVSYNKALEQRDWPTPARRDEIHLRGDWAEKHGLIIARAATGASSENEAIEAFTSSCSSAIAQHMQYLDINGVAKPRPKDWARGRKPPKWWNETLDQQFEPVQLNRKPPSDIEVRWGHMKTQYARTFAEYLTYRVREGLSDSFCQASLDAALQLFQHGKEEDIQEMLQSLPEGAREQFLKAWKGSIAVAATHSEMVL